jgi:hypothetical protein
VVADPIHLQMGNGENELVKEQRYRIKETNKHILAYSKSTKHKQYVHASMES